MTQAYPIPNEALDDRLAIVGTAGSGKTNRAGLTNLIAEWDQLIEPDHAACAYAAGFFDGEGTATIAKTIRKDCVDPAYVLMVIVAQVVLEPLVFLQHRWHGSIILRPAKPPRQRYFVWQLQANKAATFLLDTLPYLHVKRERAILGTRFQALKGGQGQARGDRTRAPIFEGFYQDMKAMNANGEQIEVRS